MLEMIIYIHIKPESTKNISVMQMLECKVKFKEYIKLIFQVCVNGFFPKVFFLLFLMMK